MFRIEYSLPAMAWVTLAVSCRRESESLPGDRERPLAPAVEGGQNFPRA
jgi:hypothetical protein